MQIYQEIFHLFYFKKGTQPKSPVSRTTLTKQIIVFQQQQKAVYAMIGFDQFSSKHMKRINSSCWLMHKHQHTERAIK